MTIKIIYKLLIVLSLFYFTNSTAQTNDNKTIWQIGEHDLSASEFALAPNDYENFVTEGFGGANRYYLIGESIPSKDWPYVLPGSFDNFIGAGYWAGIAMCKLPVYFKVDQLPKSGICKLIIDLLEVADQKPPLFRVYVNGKKYESQLKKGKSGIKPENITPNPQQLIFDIPADEFKTGINEIVFQNHYGHWSVFDAISFTGPDDFKISTPGKTLINSVNIAKYESMQDNKPVQPLLLDIIHRGKTEQLEINVDGKSYSKIIEEGHSVIEVNLPVVSEETVCSVTIKKGKEALFKTSLNRSHKDQITPADYVDQFMGTSGSRWMINPGPWMPMGMVKISPDNEDSRWKAGYEYQVENIMGFSHVHEWTMAGLLMMPTNGTLHIQPGPEINPDLGYRSRINKSTEKAEVGSYSVDLTDYDIHADITATTRASMQRYILPAEKENRVLIDLHFPAEYIWELRDAEITKVSDTEIEGWALSHCHETGYAGDQDYTLHFVIQFDRSIKKMGGWVLDRIIEETDKINKVSYEPDWHFYLDDYKITDAGAFISFPKGTQEVKVRTGISLVSIDQARLNLTEEIVKPFGWDFEAVVNNQKKVWNDLLGKVEIETDDYLQKVKFYTNLYRALSPRNTWSDVNGEWVDMNEKVQQTDPSKPIYGSDGYWGWHWNLVPFYNLIVPEYSSNWINSFLEMYDKGGWLPIGNPGMEYFHVMIGQPEIPLIVSAYQHGIRDFDQNKMFKALYHQQTTLMEKYAGGGEVGNESYNYYLDKGYVPLNKDYQSYVSNTLEYAYQDWCFSQYAKALKVDSVYQQFIKRSENWRTIFDKETGFVRPRNMDGSWLKDFSPYNSPGFCESNSWQYTWYVPQNVSGLVDEMGRKRFIEVLNRGMETSEKVNFNALGDDFSKYPINHGNESNMQSCYLFNYAGAPWLTQKWARAIQEKYYGMGPRDAYPGDEDQGQMSAWFVMSAIGLFEMDGGTSVTPYYELGSPRFEKITIHLSDKYYGGKTFTIEAKNASRENKYIHSAILNGNNLRSWRFPQKELIKGGTLILEMKSTPNKTVLKEQ